MIKQIAAGLGVLSFAVVLYSCEADWEKDYKAVTLKAPATATVSVTSIADSTALLNYSLSVTGRLYVAVVPGTDETPAPDAQAILKQTVGGAVFSKQIILNDAGALSSSVIVSGLVQNTSYKVFALPVNDDGVLGEIVDHVDGDRHLQCCISPGLAGLGLHHLEQPLLVVEQPVQPPQQPNPASGRAEPFPRRLSCPQFRTDGADLGRIEIGHRADRAPVGRAANIEHPWLDRCLIRRHIRNNSSLGRPVT